MASKKQPSRSGKSVRLLTSVARLMECLADPACDTCRRKCRKCDRARPFCNRCSSKGLACEGYSLQVKIYGQASKPARRRARSSPYTTTAKARGFAVHDDSVSQPIHEDSERLVKDSDVLGPVIASNSSPASVDRGDLSTNVPLNSPSVAQLNELLLDDKTHRLLSHCEILACPLLCLHGTDLKQSTLHSVRF